MTHFVWIDISVLMRSVDNDLLAPHNTNANPADPFTRAG